ncbi:MAG: polymorphic toxin type 50 domain-containing protein [Coriobacteriales bacterium]
MAPEGHDGKTRSDKFGTFYHAKINRGCERQDSLYLYRGIKLRGRLNVVGRMTEDEAREYVKTDTQFKTVNEKQNRHRGDNIGTRSRVDISDEEIEKLVVKYAGTGDIHVNEQPNGDVQIKERITVPDARSGVCRKIDKDGSAISSSETDSFTVHYSESGIHIVPAEPSKRRSQ